MISNTLTKLLGCRHPVMLGGMGSGTTPELVAAVANAGGYGTLGMNARNPEAVPDLMAQVRDATEQPFGVNFLLFNLNEAAFAAALSERPHSVTFAWASPEFPLKSVFDRVKAAGAKVLYQCGAVPEAKRAVAAGADVIIAQGSEGGGHVGWMGTLPLVPMMADALPALPVVAAGGIADGRGLAAALALGAQGVLLGTRFLATPESPLHANFKAAIVASDGHDTELTSVPNIGRGEIWPGAMVRVRRNRFIERWAGREWAAREHMADIKQGVTAAAMVEKHVDETLVYYHFPPQHWRRIRTNNPLERIIREIRRRTRVVGAFPDGESALMLVAARLRHIATTKWGTRRYLKMELLNETLEAHAAIA